MTIIGEIQKPAGPKLFPRDPNDMAAILGRDPAPDAMQRDEVEIALAAILGELREGRLAEMDIRRFGGGGQRPRAGDMARIEIYRGVIDMRIGRGGEIRRIALPASKFQHAQGAAVEAGPENSLRPSREGQALRRELAVIAMGVTNFGDIAGAPIGHVRFSSASADRNNLVPTRPLCLSVGDQAGGGLDSVNARRSSWTRRMERGDAAVSHALIVSGGFLS